MFAVEMKSIAKKFGDNFKANDCVDFNVQKGEIHALVGENGAGKTTLMKILYGLYHADEGKISINEKEVEILSPSEAIKVGIGMVHQHFMLVEPLTVSENIILGDETTDKFGIIDYTYSEKRIIDITERFNINVDINARVENLSVGIQQKIEILKILYRNADILILDEPTAVLTPQETDELFKTLKELKSKGKTIILITHKLGEVLSISDRVSVLRRGKMVGELQTKSTNRDELAKLIVGGEIDFAASIESVIFKNVILTVENLTVLNDKSTEIVKNVSFQIKAGEILGIAGVEGNGQSELTEAITGLREIQMGNIKVKEKELKNDYPIAHIPADRYKHGIVMDYSVSENIALGRIREKRFSTRLAINLQEIKEYTEKLINEYDIQLQNPFQIISGLSGGNQQKVVVARELTKETDLIIVNHPTRGLDIKASNFVHSSLLNERKKGKAILLVSSDLSELLSLSDRIAVMYNGKISAFLNPHDTNEREIGLYMTGLRGN